ncbi:MAG: hypothetical protein ABFR90_08265 [Planctomycetota bacterium]
MRHVAIVIAIMALGLPALSGCQKSDASQIRRARIVANENLQLEKQLEEKDRQIEELTNQIESLEAEKAEVIEQSGEASIKTLRMLLDSENRAEGLVIENRKLQEELEKLKNQ